MIQLLLKNGANIKVQNIKLERTLTCAALYVTVKHDYKNIMKRLLEGGADVDLNNDNIKNLFQAAVRNNNRGIIRLLIKNQTLKMPLEEEVFLKIII